MWKHRVQGLVELDLLSCYCMDFHTDPKPMETTKAFFHVQWACLMPYRQCLVICMSRTVVLLASMTSMNIKYNQCIISKGILWIHMCNWITAVLKLQTLINPAVLILGRPGKACMKCTLNHCAALYINCRTTNVSKECHRMLVCCMLYL